MATGFSFFSPRRLVSIKTSFIFVTIVVLVILMIDTIDVHLTNDDDHMIIIHELNGDCLFFNFVINECVDNETNKKNTLVRTCDYKELRHEIIFICVRILCNFCVYFMLIFFTKLKRFRQKKDKIRVLSYMYMHLRERLSVVLVFFFISYFLL